MAYLSKPEIEKVSDSYVLGGTENKGFDLLICAKPRNYYGIRIVIAQLSITPERIASIYIDPEQARQLATELNRLADELEEGR